MPDNLSLYIQRIERDNDMLAILESEVAAFLVEVDQDVKALLELGESK
jgi:hypothetical protein